MPDIPNNQWKYLIVDSEAGTVIGTNDEKTAKEFATQDLMYVIEVATCKWNHNYNGTIDGSIREQTTYVFTDRNDD